MVTFILNIVQFIIRHQKSEVVFLAVNFLNKV